MAELARRRGLAVEVVKFEEWEPAGRTFDAVGGDVLFLRAESFRVGTYSSQRLPTGSWSTNGGRHGGAARFGLTPWGGRRREMKAAAPARGPASRQVEEGAVHPGKQRKAEEEGHGGAMADDDNATMRRPGGRRPRTACPLDP